MSKMASMGRDKDSTYQDLTGNRTVAFHHLLEKFFFHRMRMAGIRGTNRLLSILRKVIPLPAVKGPVIVQTNVGFPLLVDPTEDKGLERSIYERGIYEAGTLFALSQILQPGDTFIDVGANIGLMTIAGSGFVNSQGQVFSFEPIPYIFNILNYNVTLNQRENIEIFEIALGARQESRAIYEQSEINRGSASLIRPSTFSDSFTINVRTVDNFVSEQDIGIVNCLKIDVEGWELEVINGARRLLSTPDAPVVIVEYSNLHPVHNGSLLDIYDLLVSVNDYQIYKLNRNKETRSALRKIDTPERLPYHDNLFCLLPRHIEEIRAEGHSPSAHKLLAAAAFPNLIDLNKVQ